MSKHDITIRETLLDGTEKDGQWLIEELEYDKGDFGRRRGYYIHAMTEGREDKGDGIIVRSFMLASGTSATALVKETHRVNPKEMAQLAKDPAVLASLALLVTRVKEAYEREKQKRAERKANAT